MGDDLREEIIRIIELNVCEVGAEGLERGEILGADTAADQIMVLLKERALKAFEQEFEGTISGTAFTSRLLSR
jgi:hypothetical protein